MKHKVITISRDYGSGGRIIGKRLAEELNIHFYDNEIIDMAAKELGLDTKAIYDVVEKKSSSFMYTLSTTHFELPLNDQVYSAQSKVIRHLASKGPCIIVSGCADYILQEYNNVYSIFIHATIESRMQRVKAEYDEEHDDLRKYVKKKDKNRKKYYNYYTDRKWGVADNYHVTIDSDIGIDVTVDMIKRLYNK